MSSRLICASTRSSPISLYRLRRSFPCFPQYPTNCFCVLAAPKHPQLYSSTHFIPCSTAGPLSFNHPISQGVSALMAPGANHIRIVTIKHPAVAFAIDMLCEWTAVSVLTPWRLARCHCGTCFVSGFMIVVTSCPFSFIHVNRVCFGLRTVLFLPTLHPLPAVEDVLLQCESFSPYDVERCVSMDSPLFLGPIKP